VIVEGTATITLDDVDHEVPAGETVEIPVGGNHRIANPGPANRSFVEVQTGDHFGQDDIMQLDDDHGRAGT
jgi:mannose-6-phosphate isomerase